MCPFGGTTAWEPLGMAWTYILECADGSLWVGSTIDLELRVSEHNLGLDTAA